MIAVNILMGMYLSIGQAVFSNGDIATIEELGFISTARILKELKSRGYLADTFGGVMLTDKAMQLCADMSAFQNHEEIFAKYNSFYGGKK